MTDLTTRLILIRHAEQDESAQGRFCGMFDVGLSATGRGQARALAAELHDAEIAAIAASPSARTLETAEQIAKDHELAVTVDEDLRELDFGQLDGRSYAEIARTMPVFYAQWMTAPTAVTFPGGESFADLRTRVGDVCTQIRADHAGTAVVLLTHAGVCRSILADVLELAPTLAFRIEVRHARTTVIDWFGDEPVVRLVNGSAVDVPPRLT